MGWVIGAGLALALLLFVAFANLLLIVVRVAMDRSDAKFLMLTIAALGSSQALLFVVAARTGIFAAPTFEILWLISMCMAILSFLAVIIFGRAPRGEEYF